MNEEQRITVCKTGLTHIYAMLLQSPDRWREFVDLARTIITHLDNTTLMRQPNRTQEQVWMIAGLQRLALCDADGGGVVDISAWCSRNWLIVQQREPHNVAALRGLGQSWLSRAQPLLNRIYNSEASSSSSGGSLQSRLSIQSTEQTRRDEEADAEAERRAGSADNVEARGYLQPAIDYFERAIAAATHQRVLSGDLLVTAAEAYMSLGNISSPRLYQRNFRRALQLLRAASNIPGYTLSRHLQEYLEDGRLLE